MTAVMAFFLLMWLLNATTEDQRKGLADYFNPRLPISRVSSGGAGMLNGDKALTGKTLSGSLADGEPPKPSRRRSCAPCSACRCWCRCWPRPPTTSPSSAIPTRCGSAAPATRTGSAAPTADGLPASRIKRVAGKAPVAPLLPDAKAPQNRRIAITLLRNHGR